MYDNLGYIDTHFSDGSVSEVTYQGYCDAKEYVRRELDKQDTRFLEIPSSKGTSYFNILDRGLIKFIKVTNG